MELQELTQRLIDQRSELSAAKLATMVLREILPGVMPLLGSALVKVVVGPRRAGKSVFCAQFLGERRFVYANFDDELLAGLRAEELNMLVESWTSIDGAFDTVLLDEVQNVEGWELFVNRLQRGGKNVVVTGSNSRLLSSELASHLTGRHRTIELMPFSFREYLAYQGIAVDASSPRTTADQGLLRRHLASYLESGGFPETLREPEPRRYLRDLYQSIISRDIAFRHQIRNVGTLRAISQYLFAHLGTRVTHHKLRNIFSIGSVHTVSNYLDHLQESYLLFLLDRYSRKPKERHIAPRKVVPIDTGMSRALSSGTDNPVGYLYETAVALELLRRRAWVDGMEVRYWQNAQGREVDFVVTVDSHPSVLIQVCFDVSDPQTLNRECRSLVAASADTGCTDLVIITDSYEGEQMVDGCRVRFVMLVNWLTQPPGITRADVR